MGYRSSSCKLVLRDAESYGLPFPVDEKEDGLINDLVDSFGECLQIQDTEDLHKMPEIQFPGLKLPPDVPSNKEEELETVVRKLFSEPNESPPLKLISAMKGSRAQHQQGALQRELTVKWAPDVFDPPQTSMSHNVKSKKQQNSMNKKNGKKGKKRQQVSGRKQWQRQKADP